MSSTEIILEPVPDKQLPSVIAKQVLEVLKQNDEAAYKVWLILASKYGAGQKI